MFWRWWSATSTTGCPRAQREAFAVPPLLARLIEKGWVGEKAGQGFYKRVKNAAGESEILRA